MTATRRTGKEKEKGTSHQLGSGQDRRACERGTVTAQVKGPVVVTSARGVRVRVVVYEWEPRWKPPGRTTLTDYGLA